MSDRQEERGRDGFVLTTLHGYQSFPGFHDDLIRELKFAGIKPKKMELLGNLVLVEGFRRKPVWASNIWGSVERIAFESVADAARKLKLRGLRWALNPHLHHRRARLIANAVHVPKYSPRRFPTDLLPTKNLGSFMLLSENELLASVHCSQTLPQGELTFYEEKTAPPTRAYLKLWEVFTRLGQMPKAGEFCIDLGSCPGGWTWVLAQLGARILSIDRSEIDRRVLGMPGVRFRPGNAFTIDPAEVERPDWIFSDVICEPRKLLELVKCWLNAYPTANFICSVKFKGETDFRVMNDFRAIPGSSLVHLTHNKHEVTWIRLHRTLPPL